MAKFKLSDEQVARGKFLDDEPASEPVTMKPYEGGGQRFALSPEQVRLGKFLDTPDTSSKPTTSAGDAALGGFVQGASGGFMDEIGGAVRGLTESHDIRNIGKDYRRNRDQLRSNFDTQQKEHGLAYGLGNFAGGAATALVPVAGVANGASLGAKALGAAKVGAAYGLGESKADLTKGEVGDAALDAVKGAGIGAATAGVLHGAGKVAGAMGRGAIKRGEDRVIGGLTEGGTAKQQTRILGEMGVKRDKLLAIAKENPELEQAALAKDTGDTLGRVREIKQGLMDKNDQFYEKAGGSDAVAPKLIKRMEGIEQELSKDPGKRPMAKIVRSKIDDIKESWLAAGEGAQPAPVMAKQLRTLATDLGPAAFQSVPGVDPGKAEKVSRDIYHAITSTIEEHAKDSGMSESAIQAMRDNNQKISTLINVENALTRRAGLEQARGTGIKMGLGDVVGGAAALSGHPLALAMPIARRIGPSVANGAEYAMAQLYKSAKSGTGVGEAVRAAVEAGVPRATAAAIVSKFGSAN